MQYLVLKLCSLWSISVVGLFRCRCKKPAIDQGICKDKKPACKPGHLQDSYKTPMRHNTQGEMGKNYQTKRMSSPDSKTPQRKKPMSKDYLEWLKQDDAKKLKRLEERKEAMRPKTKEELERIRKEEANRKPRATMRPKTKEELKREAEEMEKLGLQWDDFWQKPFKD